MPILAQITFRVKVNINATMNSIRLENVRIADLDGRSVFANWRNQVDMTSLGTHKLQNALLQNYPNPFNPETWIPYYLAEDAHVTITIYNVRGKPVHMIDLGLASAAAYISKEKASYWDGRNGQGESVASGVYYMIQASKFSTTKKLVVLK